MFVGKLGEKECHIANTQNEITPSILKNGTNQKKYIHTCAICGHKGYSPVVEEEDFDKVIFKELSKTLRKLELDEYGRCTYCARVQGD